MGLGASVSERQARDEDESPTEVVGLGGVGLDGVEMMWEMEPIRKELSGPPMEVISGDSP